MIRKFQQSDIDQVISIWLEASIKAHDFVNSEFWKSKVKDMREIYIPSGETYVYEKEGIIKRVLNSIKNVDLRLNWNNLINIQGILNY